MKPVGSLDHTLDLDFMNRRVESFNHKYINALYETHDYNQTIIEPFVQAFLKIKELYEDMWENLTFARMMEEVPAYSWREELWDLPAHTKAVLKMFYFISPRVRVDEDFLEQFRKIFPTDSCISRLINDIDFYGYNNLIDVINAGVHKYEVDKYEYPLEQNKYLDRIYVYLSYFEPEEWCYARLEEAQHNYVGNFRNVESFADYFISQKWPAFNNLPDIIIENIDLTAIGEQLLEDISFRTVVDGNDGTIWVFKHPEEYSYDY